MKLFLKKLFFLEKNIVLILIYSKVLYIYTKDIFSLHILILFFANFIFNDNILLNYLDAYICSNYIKTLLYKLEKLKKFLITYFNIILCRFFFLYRF